MCGFLLALIEQERPMGFICISPVIAQNLYLLVQLAASCIFFSAQPYGQWAIGRVLNDKP
jgi:hypothetical protein